MQFIVAASCNEWVIHPRIHLTLDPQGRVGGMVGNLKAEAVLENVLHMKGWTFLVMFKV